MVSILDSLIFIDIFSNLVCHFYVMFLPTGGFPYV